MKQALSELILNSDRAFLSHSRVFYGVLALPFWLARKSAFWGLWRLLGSLGYPPYPSQALPG